jgi:hypothetical protein
VADGEGALVVLLLVEREERRDHLAGARPERLARRAADRQHDRLVLRRDRPALGSGVADEYRRPVRRVDLLTVDRERRRARDDDVKLLLRAAAGPELVVLVDHRLALLRLAHGAGAEGADVEVAAQTDARAPVGGCVRIGVPERQDGVRGGCGGCHRDLLSKSSILTWS